MLQILQQQIFTLQEKGKEKDQRLEKLYIQFSEIYNLQNNLNNPISTQNNMLNQVRPEVFHQILIQLDFIQILRFRLLSKRANELVKWTFAHQIPFRQKQIVEKQNELQLMIQEVQELTIDPILQQTLQAAQDQLSQISKVHICEVKAYAKPPELVERIINLTCMLIEPTFKLQKDNWRECQKILSREKFLQQILGLDASFISDKQLLQLDQLNSISEQQVSAISIATGTLTRFLKGILQIRQSQFYIKQNKIKQLEWKIKKEEQLIEKMKKIIIK